MEAKSGSCGIIEAAQRLLLVNRLVQIGRAELLDRRLNGEVVIA